MFWPDSMQRRERSMQDVVDAIVIACFLNRGYVRRLFHYTDQLLVTCRAGTIDTRIHICNVVANRAKLEFFFQTVDGVCESFRIFMARTQYMKCQSLRVLCSDSGKFAQFVNEPRHGFCKS